MDAPPGALVSHEADVFEAATLDEARPSLERIAQRWDEALLRLKAAVEED